MSGRVFLTDFGLAKNTATGSKFTRSGVALGTPQYMSPEQARGESAELTPAADSWALGCVLYELLAARPAFDGDTPAAVVGAVLTSEPPAPAGAPREVLALLRACLAKDRGARVANAPALVAECDRVLHGRLPQTRPGRARRLALAAAAVTGLAAAAGLAGWWWSRPAAPTSPATPRVSEAQRQAAAAWALRGDDPRRGAAMLASAIDAEPGRAEWRLRCGLLQWASGDADAAVTNWTQVPAGAPEHERAELYIALAGLFRTNQRGLLGTPQAQGRLRLLEQRPGDTGRIARAIRTPDIAAARELLAGAGGWEAGLVAAVLESRFGDPDRSLAAYEAALAGGIRFAWALSNRGGLRHQRGDLAGAQADYDEAIATDPALVQAYLGRAELWRTRNDLAAAEADLDRALAVNQDYVDALFARGVVRAARGNLPGAVADYDAVLIRKRDHAQALLNRGVLRDKGGEMEGALADFERAIAADATLAHAWFARGRVRLRRDDNERALRDLDQAIAHGLRLPAVHIDRAMARIRLGDRAGAHADYSQAIALDPDSAEAFFQRGRLNAAEGRNGPARDDFDRAVRAGLAAASLHYERGVVRARLGDLDGARADYDAALAIDPGHVRSLASRGSVHFDQGRLDAAVADLESALRLAPPDSPYRGGIERFLAKVRAAAAAGRR